MYRAAGEPAVERVTATFDDGTLRLSGPGADAVPGGTADSRDEQVRLPAYRYHELRAAAENGEIDLDDRVLDVAPFPGLSSTYALRPYQSEAIAAWNDAGHRGVIELPTGSGKTVIGVKAIVDRNTPTLVVVPTIDLLEQWERELTREFPVEIGRFGGGEQRRGPITVSTYDSAHRKAESIGDAFGLVVFDEVHHLGGEGYREIARLLAAPARLGLTATFERPDDAHEVIADLVGDRVYSLAAEDLAGDHLADYDIKRRTVALTSEEREEYDRHQETFTDYLAQSGISMRSGDDYLELVKRSGNDPEAREALLAKQRAREIAYGSDTKVDLLAELLDRHRDDRIIVFTAHNDLAYRISERFLLPVITHQTDAAERREHLRRFRAGTYSTIVTSNVLDEGVDVPDANVAIILSGSGSEREFTQRLGRILRPSADGGRALLYEVISEDTAEERVAQRRR